MPIFKNLRQQKYYDFDLSILIELGKLFMKKERNKPNMARTARKKSKI